MLRQMIPLCLTFLCFFVCAPVHAEIQSYASAESTSEEVRHLPAPTIPVMSVKIGEFHDRGSVLTMDIPSTDTPFAKSTVRTGGTLFVNNQFANYYKTPLAMTMMLLHFPAKDAPQTKPINQSLDEMVDGFIDTVMTSPKGDKKEVRRNEALLQNGFPARRLTVWYALEDGREMIGEVLFLSNQDDVWSIQIVYDTSDPIIPYHAESLLDSAVIGTDAEE